MSAATTPRLRGLSGRTALMAHIHDTGAASWAELETWTEAELRHVARAVVALEDAVAAVRQRHAESPSAQA